MGREGKGERGRETRGVEPPDTVEHRENSVYSVVIKEESIK